MYFYVIIVYFCVDMREQYQYVKFWVIKGYNQTYKQVIYNIIILKPTGTYIPGKNCTSSFYHIYTRGTGIYLSI